MVHADVQVQRALFDGLFHGRNRAQIFGQTSGAKIFYLATTLGYHPRLEQTNGSDVFYISISAEKSEAVYRDVYYRDDLLEYIYDIETESHHFAAGVGDLIVHNSAYGGLGAQMGFIPLVEGAASVTAKGRELITEAIKFVVTKYNGLNGVVKAKLVYGDTDSCMITFEGATTAESFALGDRISKEISHFLKTKLIGVAEDYTITNPVDGLIHRIDKYPRAGMVDSDLEDEIKIKIHEYDANPVNLQFENLYERYLLLTKKRYVARATNRLGVMTAKINKGVVLARRDNCKYLKDTYDPIVDAILDKKPESEVMNILYDQVNKLFTRQIPDANLIKYVGVKTVMTYAKKQGKAKGRKAVSSDEVIYIGKDKEPLDPQPTGPMDERLVYPNIPQVMLALKMMRRGDDVPPNTRLEYIYLEDEHAVHQGEKAEDYTYYRENKHITSPDHPKGLRPDHLMYIDKQLLKPLTEMFAVKYKKEDIPYETLEDTFNRCVEELNDLLRFKVKKIKNHEKTSTSPVRKSVESVGWSAICDECASLRDRKCSKHRIVALSNRIKFISVKDRVYRFKGLMAKVQYILDSAARKRADPKLAHEFDETKHIELVKVCRQIKSRALLDRFHVAWGQPKRKIKRPKQTGSLLPPLTGGVRNEAYLVKKTGGYPRGTKVILQEAILIDDGKMKLKKYKKTYTYTIKIKPGDSNSGEEETIENVSRASLTSYRVRDALVMADILRYRTYYSMVVKELPYAMAPVRLVGADREMSFVIVDAEDNFMSLDDEDGKE